jgi:two-component system sensor histidine kinase KdpD
MILDELRTQEHMNNHPPRTQREHAQDRFSALPAPRNGSSIVDATPITEEALAAVAHDLRVPLSHIKGFVSSLRSADVVWDEETRQEFLAEIDLETDRLAELVDSLLQIGAPDGSVALGVNMTLTDPAAVIDGALHRMRGLLQGRPLRIHAGATLRSVRMDASKMERVLANLIQNAVKYGRAGTTIGISAQMSGSDELELVVEDEGPGIPPEDRGPIFEPFFRARKSEQSNVPGNGLGLAICQSIVLAHGGRLAVSDRPGGGTRFHVFLPAQMEPEQQPPRRQRLRRAIVSRWCPGAKPEQGAPVRPVAA